MEDITTMFPGVAGAARYERVKTAVEEALNAGLRYNDDVEAYVHSRCKVDDDARDLYMGMFDQPTDRDSQHAWTRDLGHTIGTSPRGTWAVLRMTRAANGEIVYRAMISDGSGRTATGCAHDWYDAPPTFEYVYARMVGYEIYTIRKIVEAAAATAANLAAIAAHNLAAGREFKNVNLGFSNGKANRVTIESISDEGVLTFNVIKRGSARRYRGTSSASAFVDKAGLARLDTAGPSKLSSRAIRGAHG